MVGTSCRWTAGSVRDRLAVYETETTRCGFGLAADGPSALVRTQGVQDQADAVLPRAVSRNTVSSRPAMPCSSMMPVG
jgi:hypothetical protein